MPHFSLAISFVTFPCKIIARMNLNRQVVLRFYKFNKKWKFNTELFVHRFSGDVAHVNLYYLFYVVARQKSVADNRKVTRNS